MDLPPPNEPTTVEIQKMDQKRDLMEKIKKMCEATKDIKESIPVSLDMRAYFLDICNATNVDEIFSFKAAHFILNGCRDGLESRYVSDYGINPEFLKYHIDTDDIFDLKYLIENSGEGKPSIYAFRDGCKLVPVDKVMADNDTFEAIYTIMKDYPDFTPQFTTFTFGGTLKDLPPLRDENGEPNLEFFHAWKQKTEAKYYGR